MGSSGATNRPKLQSRLIIINILSIQLIISVFASSIHERMTSPPFRLSLSDLKAASERIRPHVHLTPVLTSSALDELSGRKLFFKCENMQKTGSFKPRGATNAIIKAKESNPVG